MTYSTLIVATVNSFCNQEENRSRSLMASIFGTMELYPQLFIGQAHRGSLILFSYENRHCHVSIDDKSTRGHYYPITNISTQILQQGFLDSNTSVLHRPTVLLCCNPADFPFDLCYVVVDFNENTKMVVVFFPTGTTIQKVLSFSSKYSLCFAGHA